MVANRGQVLIVEDSLAVAKRLQSSLERARFGVDVARNGREAWGKAQKRQYDLIITDEQMPLMSGRELCERLREDSRYANTPIIFLSAAELEDSEEVRKLNVSASFTKPFVPTELVRAVESEFSAASQARRGD